MKGSRFVSESVERGSRNRAGCGRAGGSRGLVAVRGESWHTGCVAMFVQGPGEGKWGVGARVLDLGGCIYTILVGFLGQHSSLGFF
jgi:hypothetical protein